MRRQCCRTESESCQRGRDDLSTSSQPGGRARGTAGLCLTKVLAPSPLDCGENCAKNRYAPLTSLVLCPARRIRRGGVQASRDRILTTHVGSLPRTDAVVALLEQRENGGKIDTAKFNGIIRQSVVDVVKRQVNIGIDVVSDGETSKISYATYVKDRLTGFSEEGSTEPAKPHL